VWATSVAISETDGGPGQGECGRSQGRMRNNRAKFYALGTGRMSVPNDEQSGHCGTLRLGLLSVIRPETKDEQGAKFVVCDKVRDQ
jgi:hypothetical protein